MLGAAGIKHGPEGNADVAPQHTDKDKQHAALGHGTGDAYGVCRHGACRGLAAVLIRKKPGIYAGVTEE